jgi:hypothetical protein
MYTYNSIFLQASDMFSLFRGTHLFVCGRVGCDDEPRRAPRAAADLTVRET